MSQDNNGKLTHAQRGRLGGLTTAARYGPEYMSQIGRRGAQIFHERYNIQPIGTSYYAIVDRQTGRIVNYLTPPYHVRRQRQDQPTPHDLPF